MMLSVVTVERKVTYLDEGNRNVRHDSVSQYGKLGKIFQKLSNDQKKNQFSI